MLLRALALTTLVGISLGIPLGIRGVIATGSDPLAPARAIARFRITLAGGQHLGTDGVVLQATPADCGPAALASLLRYVGRPAAADTIAALAGTGGRGTRLGRLADAATAVGAPASAVRLAAVRREPSHLARRLPIMAWIDRSHYVVIASQRRDGRFVILDPLVGAYALPFTALVARWSGEALVLQ